MSNAAKFHQIKVPKSNLTAEEWRAMKSLREDKDIVILPADKGKCLVVMDTKEHIRKINPLKLLHKNILAMHQVLNST